MNDALESLLQAIAAIFLFGLAFLILCKLGEVLL